MFDNYSFPPIENIILQEPALITASEGESVNITCNFKHPNILGMYLRQKFVKDMDVLYATGQGKNKTVVAEYKGRIQYFEQRDTVTIMIQQLQKNDSGNYTCDGAVLIDQEPKLMQGSGTILVVTGKCTLFLNTMEMETAEISLQYIIARMGIFSFSITNCKQKSSSACVHGSSCT